MDFLRTELSRTPTSLSPFISMQVIFHEATSSSCHWNQNRKKFDSKKKFGKILTLNVNGSNYTDGTSVTEVMEEVGSFP